MTIPLENYVGDCVKELKEAARNAKRDSRAKEDPFKLGYLMAMHAVISLLQQQAAAFQIPLKKLNLDDIDPDRDLL